MPASIEKLLNVPAGAATKQTEHTHKAFLAVLSLWHQQSFTVIIPETHMDLMQVELTVFDV